MGAKPCATPDCSSTALKGRLCYSCLRKHYQGDRRCTFPGCDRPYYCRDLCVNHYRASKRLGDPALWVPYLPRPPRPACTIEDCDRAQVGDQGWCDLHHDRWRRTGDPGLVRKRGAKPRLDIPAEVREPAMKAHYECYTSKQRHATPEDLAAIRKYNRWRKALREGRLVSTQEELNVE